MVNTKKKSKYKLTNDYNMFYYLKLNELIELCSKIFFLNKNKLFTQVYCKKQNFFKAYRDILWMLNKIKTVPSLQIKF